MQIDDFSDTFAALPISFQGDHMTNAAASLAQAFAEPAFDDDPMASALAEPTILGSLLFYRAEWIAAGGLWRGSNKLAQPEGWSSKETLKTLGKHAGHLF
jgi:hypothetical protein